MSEIYGNWVSSSTTDTLCLLHCALLCLSVDDDDDGGDDGDDDDGDDDDDDDDEKYGTVRFGGASTLQVGPSTNRRSSSLRDVRGMLWAQGHRARWRGQAIMGRCGRRVDLQRAHVVDESLFSVEWCCRVSLFGRGIVPRLFFVFKLECYMGCFRFVSPIPFSSSPSKMNMFSHQKATRPSSSVFSSWRSLWGSRTWLFILRVGRMSGSLHGAFQVYVPKRMLKKNITL